MCGEINGALNLNQSAWYLNIFMIYHGQLSFTIGFSALSFFFLFHFDYNESNRHMKI